MHDPGGGPIQFFLNSGQNSCLVAAQVLHNPGAPGVAVSASINVGAVTGPMRFVLQRNAHSLIAGGEACCSLEQYGNVFTPLRRTRRRRCR